MAIHFIAGLDELSVHSYQYLIVMKTRTNFDRIRDQFPDAQRYSDICWSMLSKLPELNERSLMYSQRRFGILAKVVLDKSPEQIKVEKHSKKILRKLQKMTVANSLDDKLYSKHPVAAKCFAKDVSSEIVVVKDVATKPSELSAEFVSDEDDLY